MSVRDMLARMRAGGLPSDSDLAAFAQGLADGSVSEGQAGAFAMAVCTGPGLGETGRVALTRAMTASGRTMAWDLPGAVVDKHSTGGIGDPVSLVLAPALAACGVYVPMISGRGLGHTGGTLDKLGAISGVDVEQGPDAFAAILSEAGVAIVAASSDIAPADRVLYAVRDVTGTVDQIDLITASILSKKLAAGLRALVLDVKCGSGAFMRDTEAAETLARALVDTACGAGCPTAAHVTAMDEPLAPACGNALEVLAVMEVLTGVASCDRLGRVSAALGGTLLHLAGTVATAEEGAARIAAAIAGGDAAERFGRMISAQGGPSDFAERWADRLPAAPVVRTVTADRAGHVQAMDGTALGQAVVALGGGRQRPGDRIDPSVGLSQVIRIGEAVAAGTPLARVHAADDAAAERAADAVRAAIRIGEEQAKTRPLIGARIG